MAIHNVRSEKGKMQNACYVKRAAAATVRIGPRRLPGTAFTDMHGVTGIQNRRY
jgi:hypothetical protein